VFINGNLNATISGSGRNVIASNLYLTNGSLGFNNGDMSVNGSLTLEGNSSISVKDITELVVVGNFTVTTSSIQIANAIKVELSGQVNVASSSLTFENSTSVQINGSVNTSNSNFKISNTQSATIIGNAFFKSSTLSTSSSI